MKLEVILEEQDPTTIVLARKNGTATLWIDDRPYQASMRQVGRAWELSVEDRIERLWLVVDQDTVHVHLLGRAWRLEVFDPVERSLRVADQHDTVTAPMPGTVVSVAVAAGEEISVGQPLIVIESMKMQSEMTAWRDGVVERVHLEVGDTFDRGDALLALAPEDGGEG